jgi:hypothetical protein
VTRKNGPPRHANAQSGEMTQPPSLTPYKAAVDALATALGVLHGWESTPPGDAEAVLDALPEGWALVNVEDVTRRMEREDVAGYFEDEHVGDEYQDMARRLLGIDAR